ncbi:MAG: NADH-quinone oxidoreductase subunit N [Ignavibacteria bacterium]|nr:MAG: NADH-quinone oxidoreductase subunit N [Ignavibacteria bacterium]
MEQLLTDTWLTAPIGGTILLSLIVIMINALKKDSLAAEYWVSLIGIAANIVLAVVVFPDRGTAFSGMVMTGGYASITAILFLTAAGLTILLSREYIEKIGVNFGEFYHLILLATTGMMTFSAGTDLVVTFIGLELMSISLYVLAGISRRHHKGNEAALKYFLLGAFASGFFLYGIALIYGMTSTTNILEIAQNMQAYMSEPLFLTGVGLLLVGFAFKVGAVPFHMWVPDVYEGSPTMVSAFMSTGAKASAFTAFLLIFTATFDIAGTQINTVLAILAVASMVIGNVVALSQNNIKRMLAYSSIAHAGYMLIGLTAGGMMSITGVLFYLISYMFTNIGAFGIAAIIENKEQGGTEIDNFRGLYYRHPALAVMMSIFMFSLVGLPPLAGFFGKYYIFVAAIENGYTWLTIIGVITSMISVYYYLRVVVVMFFQTDEEAEKSSLASSSVFALLLSAAGVLLIGVFPSMVLDWMSRLF